MLDFRSRSCFNCSVKNYNRQNFETFLTLNQNYVNCNILTFNVDRRMNVVKNVRIFSSGYSIPLNTVSSCRSFVQFHLTVGACSCLRVTNVTQGPADRFSWPRIFILFEKNCIVYKSFETKYDRCKILSGYRLQATACLSQYNASNYSNGCLLHHDAVRCRAYIIVRQEFQRGALKGEHTKSQSVR